MSSILVSPAEPPSLKSIGSVSTAPERFGADFLIPGPGYLIGVQRKQFPADFLMSLHDGRLSESLLALTQDPVQVRILILEGRPAWSNDGVLVGFDYGGGATFTRGQLRSLLFSAQYKLGVSHHWTDSTADTIEFLRTLSSWADKPEHDSLFRRAGFPRGELSKLNSRDRALFFLQGFDGIGYTTAAAIYDHFGFLPIRWEVSAQDLAEVPGVGRTRVRRLTEFIKEGSCPTP